MSSEGTKVDGGLPDEPPATGYEQLEYGQRWISKQVENLSQRLLGPAPGESSESMDVRLTLMESHAYDLEEQLGAIQKRLQGIEQKSGHVLELLRVMHLTIRRLLLVLTPAETKA